MNSPQRRRGGLPRFLSERHPQKRDIPTLFHLSLFSVCSPFFLGDLTEEQQKKDLNKILPRITNEKGLKAKFFSHLLEQGCHEGPILSCFSSTKGGFLTSLDLSGTKVSNQGLTLVGTIKTLSTLVLRSCGNFDDGGLAGLVRGACASWLKVLDLSKCRKVTDPGLSHLLSLSQLQTLDLSDLLVTNEGVAELHVLTKLQQLSLSRTKITDGAIEAFVEDFEPNSKGTRRGLASLTTLKLCSVELTARTVILLARFPSLALVDLFGCWPSEDIWDKFQEELVRHRGGGAEAHRTTGKIVVTIGEEEKVDVEHDNSWKLVCPSQVEWNTRRLISLLHGSEGGGSPSPLPSPCTPPDHCRRKLLSPSASRFSSPLCSSRQFSSPLFSSPARGGKMPSLALPSAPSPNYLLQPRALIPTANLPKRDEERDEEKDEDTTQDFSMPIQAQPHTKPAVALNRLCLIPRADSPRASPTKKKSSDESESEDEIFSDDEMTFEDLLPLSSLRKTKNKENTPKSNQKPKPTSRPKKMTPVPLGQSKTLNDTKRPAPVQTRKRRKIEPDDPLEAGVQSIYKSKPKPKPKTKSTSPADLTKGKGSSKLYQKYVAKGKKAEKPSKEASQKTAKPAPNPTPHLPKSTKLSKSPTKANTSSPSKEETKGKASMKIYQKNARRAKRGGNKESISDKKEQQEVEQALLRSEVEKERVKRIQSYREMRKFCADSELSIRKRKRSAHEEG